MYMGYFVTFVASMPFRPFGELVKPKRKKKENNFQNPTPIGMILFRANVLKRFPVSANIKATS